MLHTLLALSSMSVNSTRELDKSARHFYRGMLTARTGNSTHVYQYLAPERLSSTYILCRVGSELLVRVLGQKEQIAHE
jgi:hypothetical protein